jgi:hypothetical protein
VIITEDSKLSRYIGFSLGSLPNDVRTHFIAQEDKENVLIANLLLFKAGQNIDNHNKNASKIPSI